MSAPPFDSLNLGNHVGDSPRAVQANRQKLQATLAQITPGVHTVFLQQVHGIEVALLQETASASQEVDVICADACISASRGIACTIMVADCLPVLLTNRQGTVVAAAHAGWRGLAGGSDGMGILEAVFNNATLTQTGQALEAIKIGANATKNSKNSKNSKDLKDSYSAAEALVWLGPCIGPLAFEVGAEVRDAFCRHDSAAAVHFQKNSQGRFLADLAALARQRLHALGVSADAIYGNDSSAGWCTVGNPLRFFSHRHGSTSLGGSGRMAACIWRS